MNTVVNIPLRLRVNADTLRERGEVLEQRVSEAVGRALLRAATVLARGEHAGVPVFHPPDPLWGGAGLGELTEKVRSDTEARLLRAIESQVAKHRPVPAVRKRPRVERPWFVVKTVHFHTTPRRFFEFREKVRDREEPLNPLELYAHLLDQRTRAVAWLVQVNREFPVRALGSEVDQRFVALAKLSNKQTHYAAYTWSARLRQMLVDIDRDGALRGISSLKKYRKHLEIRTEEGTGRAAYLKPGGRLLFAFMVLPAFDLQKLVQIEPTREAVLPLRELDSLVDATAFSQTFGPSWDDVVKAYGDAEVPLLIEPFTVEQPVFEHSLEALFEARRRLTSGVSRVGRTLLLSDASLAPLTFTAQALLRAHGNAETRDLPGAQPQGRTWKPGWRGTSITPRFGLSREQLEVAPSLPWARQNAAEIASYLRLDRYARHRKLWFWLVTSWPDTERYALLELLLQELERLGMHEQFLTVLRDDASRLGFRLRPMVRLIVQTRYAELARRLGLVEAYARVVRTMRRHTYDVATQEVHLWHEADRRVPAGAVFADYSSIFQEQIEALRPTEKTMERLAGPTRKRAGELMGQMLCEGRQRTQEELITQAMQEAAKKLDPPLEEKDFEKVTVCTSLRLVRLEGTDPHDPSLIRVYYQRVRRINDGPWENLSDEVHADDVEKFGLYLWAYELKNIERGITTLATIEMVLLGGFFLAEAGAVGFAVRLAGGRLAVLVGITVREAIYFYKIATSQEEFTLGGFLLNAFKGWLDAVGFRLGSLAGGALGKLVTAGGVRLLLTGAAVRVLTRALGVGVSFVVEQFVEDLIVLVRCNKWTGSASKYVQQLRDGFIAGLLFEFLAPALGAAAKPVLERLLPLLRSAQGKLEVAKALLRELTPEQAALWLRISVERLEAWMRELLDNPQVIQEMREALRGKAREFVDTLPEALKALKAAPGRAYGEAKLALKKEYQLAFFQDIFDLAGLELRGEVLEGLERLLGVADTPEILALVRELLKEPKLAGSFLGSLQQLEPEVLRRLIASGELRAIISSSQLLDFFAGRPELGWGLLTRVFEGSLRKLELLLHDLEPLGPEARDAVLELLRTRGHLFPSALRGRVEVLVPLSKLEDRLLAQLDEPTLERLAKQKALTPEELATLRTELERRERRSRLDVLLRKVTTEPITAKNSHSILEKVKQAEASGEIPVSYELRKDLLTRSDGELKTIEAYTYTMPPGLDYHGQQRWLEDASHWLPERRAIQQRIVADELAKAQALSTRLGDPGVVYALRGNTAAGKTTTVKRHPTIGPKALDPRGELSGVINPDTYKARIVDLEEAVTASQAHLEGGLLSAQVEEAMLASEGSALVFDRRFSWPNEIPDLLQAIGTRKLKLIDIDVPLETSAVRVLTRNPGSTNPLVAFEPVAQGFAGIRGNRLKLLEGDPKTGFLGVQRDPRIVEYELHVTNAQGESVLVVSKRNDVWTGLDTPEKVALFEQAVPRDEASTATLGQMLIDDAFIRKVTAAISDSNFRVQVERRLSEYKGMTLKDALDAHSRRTK